MKIDKSKLDPPNLHALVIDVIGEVGYKLAVILVFIKVFFQDIILSIHQQFFYQDLILILKQLIWL